MKSNKNYFGARELGATEPIVELEVLLFFGDFVLGC